MEGFDFLLKASFLAWVIANPEEGSGFEFSTRFELPSSVYKEWALETSICVLAIGPLAFLLNIGQIHFQDEYVATVVSRFPDQDPTKVPRTQHISVWALQGLPCRKGKAWKQLVCQQTIWDKSTRFYPAQCANCSKQHIPNERVNIAPTTTSLSKSAYWAECG